MNRFFFYKKYIQILTLTKFNYKHIHKITTLKNINLKFDFKNSLNLLTGLVALKLITNKTPILQKEILKNKKNVKPVIKGAYISLTNNEMYYFFDKLIHLYLPKLQFFKGFLKDNINQNTFNYKIEDISIFTELEDEFENFILLKNLKIDFFFSTKNEKQNSFFFQICNIPIK